MSNRYACLPVDGIARDDRRLVALRHGDMLDIMRWRNAQLAVLRQRDLLTADQQERYFQDVVAPSFAQRQPRQLLFTYLCGQEAIGYGGLVHISWEDRRAEVSFLVAPERVENQEGYAQDFSLYLSMIKELAFCHLGFMRLFTETYDIRNHHIRVLESSGFRLEGRLQAHVRIDGRPVDSLIHGCVLLADGAADKRPSR